MKGKRVYGLVFVIVLLTALLAVGIVQAAGHNMTTVGDTVTINGAIFDVFDPSDPSGSGRFESFVRLGGGDVIRGYNTDYRPLQFDENNAPTFTLSRLLSEVPQVKVGGILYREYQLDINQNTSGDDKYETLDTVELYESPFINLCGYPFDGSGGSHSGCTTDNLATNIYDMDAGENSFMVLDYSNNEGSGKRDLRLRVPDSLFNQDPNCHYLGTGCTVYVTFYTQFGEDFDAGHADPLLQVPHVNNDGFEEWGVTAAAPTAITLNQVGIGSSELAIAIPLAIAMVLVIATVIVLWQRRRSFQN